MNHEQNNDKVLKFGFLPREIWPKACQRRLDNFCTMRIPLKLDKTSWICYISSTLITIPFNKTCLFCIPSQYNRPVM